MVKITKSKFEKAAKGSGGVITAIAKKLAISRMALYDWIKKPGNEYVKELLEQERFRFIDLAETGLMYHIKKKDLGAIKYALSTIGKNRGYVEKQEVEHTGIDNINISFGEPVNPEKLIEPEKPKMIEKKE